LNEKKTEEMVYLKEAAGAFVFYSQALNEFNLNTNTVII